MLRRYTDWSRRRFFQTLLAATGLANRRAGAGIFDQFNNPPDSAKMVLYYWWFGPSQTEAQVFRELDAMRAAGIGGVFIFPVYPLSASEDVNYPYLSDKFLHVLDATVRHARTQSMSVDLLVGAGWPFGGPMIPFEQSSRTLRRAPRDAALREGEKVVAVDETAGVSYISSPTRQRVKSAGFGTEGWVLDHLDRHQVESYLNEVAGKLVSSVPTGSLRSINFDSLEAFGQDWTPNFPDEFRKRRGYDLVPHLAALWDETGEDTPHIRCDYWRTLADLFLDNFEAPFHEWSRAHGVLLQGKPMGSPINDLRAFQHIDLSVAEEYDWLEFGGPRWAASGAHVYGQNLVGNEGYTWLREPRYVTSLCDLKVGSDVQFLAGVNIIIGHGFPYSPGETGIPGWSYYAAVYFHPKNPWWPYFKHLAKYVQRVSFILQQGVPVADIALFLPEEDEIADSPAGALNRGQKVIVKARLGKPGQSLPQFGLDTSLQDRSPLVSTIVTNGYAFDGINNDALQRASIENGRLRIGLGDYGVLVLPSIRGLPVESMEKIRAFSMAGGKVIAIRETPSLCYGLERWREKSARVRALAAEVFRPGGGLIVSDEESSLLRALRESHPPDIDFFRAADLEVGFVHRRTPEHDFYFLANTSPQPKRLQALFRIGHRQPEIWDPMTGHQEIVAEYTFESNGTNVPIHLEAYASTIIAFGAKSQGRLKRAKVKPARASQVALVLNGPWTLEIGGHTESLDRLVSWTQFERFRYFSGTVKYRTVFDLDKSNTSKRFWLHFGEIHEIAEAELNGDSIGVAWMPPYQLEITGKTRPGRNVLEVKVTNLLINRVLGQPDPDVSELVAKLGKRFSQLSQRPDLKFTQNFEKEKIPNPLPSGLLGPVEIHVEI
jgi:hypothetical protein